MTNREHVSDDLLLRSIDDELNSSQAGRVETHLQFCFECRRRLQEFRALSGKVDALLGAIPVSETRDDREALESKLQAFETRSPRRPAFSLARIGAGIGLAASLALAVLFVPARNQPDTDLARPAATRIETAFEIDGERFLALPYSNPDLPVGESRIVRMQVPVSALADAGVVFEPVSDQMTAPDRTVLADVLLGIDGQPLGVHVLTSE